MINWQWMSWRKPETAIGEIAQRASALVSESVRQLVDKRIITMGQHEARGYVRARAGHLILEGISMVTAHDRPGRRHSVEAILTATLNELLPVLMRRPVPVAVQIRRAA